MTPSRNRVVLGGEPGAITITAWPQGVVTNAARFAHALRIAENIARERSCALFNETGLEPLSGDAGPSHLIDSPRVFVINDAGEWIVCVMGRPGLEQCFIGPNAERAARRHGDKLFAAFCEMAIAEQGRRDRIKELKRNDVEAREVAR
jgi:hypothetical protein